MKTIPPEIWSSWLQLKQSGGPIETTGNYALIINVLFLALVVPSVTLRVYTRAFTSRWLGLDDIFIIGGLLFAVGLTVTSIIANYKYDCNMHIWDTPFANWSTNLKLALVAKVMFVTSGSFVRQSLLHFYLRLIGDADLRNVRWTVYAVSIVNISSFVIFNAISIFLCNPVWAYWTYPSDYYGNCMDEGKAVIWCSSIIVVLDVIVLLLPLNIIMKLQMPLRRKIGVGVLLNLGLISVAAAIVRIYYSWKAFVQTYDITWYATPVWVCVTIEVDLAIMCACAPAVRSFLLAHFPAAIEPFRYAGNRVASFFSLSRSSKKSTTNESCIIELGDSDRKPKGQRLGPEPESQIGLAEKHTYYAADLETGRSPSTSSNDGPVSEDRSYRTIDKEAVLFATQQAIQGIQPLPSHLLDTQSQPTTRIVYDHGLPEDADVTISLDDLDEHNVRRSRSTRTQRTQKSSMTARRRSSDEMDLPVKLAHSVESAYIQDTIPTRTPSQSSRRSLGVSTTEVERSGSQRSRGSHREEDGSRPASTISRGDDSSQYRSEWAARQEANMLAARHARRVDVPRPTRISTGPRQSLSPILQQEESGTTHTPTRESSLIPSGDPSLVSENTSRTHGRHPTFLLDESSTEDGEEDERARQVRAREMQRIRELMGHEREM